MTKVSSFGLKLRNWMFFMQMNYKKSLKIKKLNDSLKYYFINYEKNINYKKKRLFCGGLRFIPMILNIYLINFLFPWENNFTTDGIYHKTGIFFILKKNDPVCYPLFFSQWNIWWFLSQKKKNLEKNIKRIKFPIFDDNEEIGGIQPITLVKKKKFTKKNNFWSIQNFKENFFQKEIFPNSFFLNSRKNSILIDPSLKMNFIKIQFLCGLGLSEFKKIFFINIFQLVNTKFFIKKKKNNFLNSNFRKFHKCMIHSKKKNCYSSMFPLNLRYAKKPKTIVFTYFMYFSNFFFFKKKSKKNNKLFLNGIIFKKFNNYTHNKGKSYFPFSEFFIPFFFDFFFSEKGVMFYFERKLIETCNFRRFYLLKWAHTVPLLRGLIFGIDFSKNSKNLLSFYSLLKKFFVNQIVNKNRTEKKKLFFEKLLEKNFFFKKVQTTWIDSGVQICSQSYKMMKLLIERKNLIFLNLDFNFNLKPTKTLSTKERKKSRFSNTFHFLREILRFTKLLVDSHLKFKRGLINLYQLSDGIHYIFTHLGHLTGIYRYKYKIMKQIHFCKSIKRVLYEKFNQKISKKGPGFGFWGPVWRVWIFFLRGIVPLLSRWLSNLLSRHFFGRQLTKKALEFSKQRSDSYFDIGIKRQFMGEIFFFRVKNEQMNPKYTLNLFNEAWRCWKSNIFWDSKKIPKNIKNLIFKFVKLKADYWIRTTFIQREKILKEKINDKNLMKKNLGRLTRIWFKREKKKNIDQTMKGFSLNRKEFFLVYNLFVRFLEKNNVQKIPFPSFSFKSEIKLLILALESLSDLKKKTNEKDIDFFLRNPFLTLNKIKEQILTKKSFSEIGLDFLDNFSHLIPVFKIELEENITDAFLDQFLWYHVLKNSIFPSWVKPTDKEIISLNVYKTFAFLNNFLDEKKILNFDKISISQIKISESFESVDHVFLRTILNELINSFLTNFIFNRLNTKIAYKDMKFVKFSGVLKGLKFSPFLIQIYLFLIDLLIVGDQEYFSIKKTPENKNRGNKFLREKKEIYFYSRYLTNIIIIYEEKNLNIVNGENSVNLNLGQSRNFLKNSFIYKITHKIPVFMGKILTKNSICVVKNSKIQKNIYPFEICNFLFEKKSLFSEKNIFISSLSRKKPKTKIFRLNPSANSKNQFQYRLRQIILGSSSTTFSKITNKWNSCILGTILYFRENLFEDIEFQKIFLKSEEKIQARIKIAFNSKMPSRFPQVLFYSPKELGGLGMLSSIGGKISNNDLKFFYRKTKESEIGLNIDIKRKSIPSLNRYFLAWENEFKESKIVWKKYLQRRLVKKTKKLQLLFEDVKDLLDRGIPRINTLFQRNKHLLPYDHGWRIRGDFKKYQKTGIDPFWWINEKHDGKLWNLKNFRIDILEVLGGIENILEHTLFKGTFFSSWEGLFWEKASGSEDNFASKKLTKAQKGGLNQIPNRRFTLWWSPTINRADVYVGFQVQLDLTGIFMHGKIPTLKISLIQIFRGHLWEKIHESLTVSICKALEENLESLKIEKFQKENIHPRKSYKMNSSCADLVLFSKKKWNIESPSIISSNEFRNNRTFFQSNKFWIDIQLRWGNFDSHDIERYSRAKFLDYSNDKNSVYPCRTGILISFDLAYNIASAFGYWFPNLKFFLKKELEKIMKTNPSLFILRERIKKSLRLYTNEIKESFLDFENFFNIFSSTKICLVDDTSFYRVGIQKTKQGNLVSRPINGVLFFFEPQTGVLCFKVIHAEFWKGHKRLTQFSKWKVGEEINYFISSISQKDRPKVLISIRKGTLDSIQIHLIDYPEILVRGIQFRINLQNLLKLKIIGHEIFFAKFSKMSTFFLFDDWLSKISAFTAFSRLILILNVIEIDYQSIKNLFGNYSNDLEKHIWPNFSEKKWIKIEILLKDIILRNYCQKFGVSIHSLSESDVKNIIFGIDLIKSNESSHPVDCQKQDLETSISLNKTGEKIISLVSRKTSFEKFISISNWKNNFDFLNSKRKIFSFINVEFFKINENIRRILFPRNLLKIFLSLTKIIDKIITYLFGKHIKNEKIILEVRILVIPNQIFKKNKMEFDVQIFPNKILKNLKFFGFLRKSFGGKISPGKKDYILLESFFKKNPSIKPISPVIIISGVFSHVSVLLGFFFEKKKKNFKIFVEKKGLLIILSQKFFGFFLRSTTRDPFSFLNKCIHKNRTNYYSISYPNIFSR